MNNGLKGIVENDLFLQNNSVWVLNKSSKFTYSDGRASERYLEKVFTHSSDLSYSSPELEKWTKDWVSEYHLSKKRSQLFGGVDFDKSSEVLEVGCGCGAITRFLGETFDKVIAVEGSNVRARLARMRTKDLDNVFIISAPFHEIKFKTKFDMIFCIGVFEYSPLFVKGADSFNEMLRYFRELLTQDGILVIAIENQFGLKYFSSSREDHVGEYYEGLEGYPRFGERVKTFGYTELKNRVLRFFNNCEFYFPFPDYKMPTCILDEKFLSSGQAGELISQIKPCDYRGKNKSLWDERLTYLELDKNKMLPFFANSFLLAISNEPSRRYEFEQLGIFFTSGRKPEYQTITRIIELDNQKIVVDKRRAVEQNNSTGLLTLQEGISNWKKGLSLQTTLVLRCKRDKITLGELFSPCCLWANELKKMSYLENGVRMIDGSCIDYIWKNSYLKDGKLEFMDKEWKWSTNIEFKFLVARAIYRGLIELFELGNLASELDNKNTGNLMIKIGRVLGINLNKRDIKSFAEKEYIFQRESYGASAKERIYLKLYLRNRRIFYLLRSVKEVFKVSARKLRFIIMRLVSF